MTPIEVSATAENRIKGLIAIRDCVRNLIELQTEDFPDEDIVKEQTRLNSLYDSFTKKYGLINSRANNSAFSQDSSYSLLSALEIIGDEGELERKADMFSKRTIKPHKTVTHCDSVSEALAVSMGEKAQIDMAYMCELTGKTEEEIFADLKGVIFLNPLYEYGSSNFQKYRIKICNGKLGLCGKVNMMSLPERACEASLLTLCNSLLMNIEALPSAMLVSDTSMQSQVIRLPRLN